MNTLKVAAFAIGTTFSLTLAASQQNLAMYEKKLLEHPSLAAFLHQRSALIAQSESADSFPDPELVVGIDNLPIDNLSFNDYLPTSKVLGVRQKIPSLGALSESKKGYELQSERVAVEQLYMLSKLKGELKTNMAFHRSIELQLKLVSEKLSVIDDIERSLEAGIESGVTPYSAIAQLEVERLKILRDKVQLTAQRKHYAAELIALVDDIPKFALPSISKVSETDKSKKLFPLLIAESQIGIETQNVKTSQTAFDPTYSAQFLYKQRTSGDRFDGDDWISLQATISVPLWDQNKASAGRDSAKAKRRKAESNYANTKLEWDAKLDTWSAEIVATEQDIKILSELLTKLERVFDALESDYESGGVNEESLLRNRLSRLEIEQQLIANTAKLKRSIYVYNSHFLTNSEASYESE